MQIAYFWLSRVPMTSCIEMTGTSSHTCCDFAAHFRQLVADSLETEDCIIGGPGIVVEIDESKIAKRKYNRGHHIEGAWVFGGIERTEEKKVFITHVADRSAKTLLEAIQKFVRPGSIIYSDMWRGYNGITERLGFEHLTVNHSIGFVDSVTGVHTNTIEATWCGLKLLIPKRNRTVDIDNHLWEYIWRKLHAKTLWRSFLFALKDVAYD